MHRRPPAATLELRPSQPPTTPRVRQTSDSPLTRRSLLHVPKLRHVQCADSRLLVRLSIR
eukprot:scaffold18704_cov47-Phaeocystis_antarctica.AAC.2